MQAAILPAKRAIRRTCCPSATAATRKRKLLEKQKEGKRMRRLSGECHRRITDAAGDDKPLALVRTVCVFLAAGCTDRESRS